MPYLTIVDIIGEYGERLAELKESWFNLVGDYPYFDDKDFWESREVNKLEVLLKLYWDLREAK